MPTEHCEKLILITGGHGFIGSHVARRLFNLAYRIRIVDIAPHALLDIQICNEFIHGNLCDITVCQRAVQGVHTVLHFAATMGGMGTIHDGNDFVIYAENQTMTRNVLEASIGAGVKCLFYASSACVYPESLQTLTSEDISLREADIWAHLPPKPQGLYGFEKLVSEMLIQQLEPKIDVRIARFHNVYGPGGAWRNGREKAPAAMLRKAVIAKLLHPQPTEFELWGDGSQRRSFLYIEDAVEAVVNLLHSNSTTPFNVGSDSPITIKELAKLALTSVGVKFDDVTFTYDESKPTGVASRNSNNELITSHLGWKPKTPLEIGMYKTGEWIQRQIDELVAGCRDAKARDALLLSLQRSRLVSLDSEKIVFAILLPITSRGSRSHNNCLSNLAIFAQSLNETTWRDTRSIGGTRFHVRVYLAIDLDDVFLLPKGDSDKAKMILHEADIMDVKTLICNRQRGHICSLWRDCAREAWNDGCDYLTLMGDDVTLRDEGWMRVIHDEFTKLTSTEDVPFGFGCVAFTDTSFPGMPTFPVVHRTHMDIFEGVVVPKVFVNQDGDPFLFQLYRRWGCAKMVPSRIVNGIGGADDARYTKEHAKEWTFDTLSHAVSITRNWLQGHESPAEEKLTLDIIIPCYRVDLKILHSILDLKPSKSCAVTFIIIIDNPTSPHVAELETRYAVRPDVRIRKNEKNLGASESRNKGMQESAADWVHFLDDDVVPDRDLLVNAEKIIRAHPDAAGFVGTTLFPRAESIFTTAVHLAGVTYFWNIAMNAELADDVPWGVTANLIARRSVNDGIVYDPSYPKTGGGEDIDFCRKKRDFFINHLGGKGFIAAPNVIATHPWWNGGARSYWRFYMWSFGDGALVKSFPSFTYRDIALNSAELLLACIFSFGSSVIFVQWMLAIWALKASVAIILANIIYDLYVHLWKHPERDQDINSGVHGFSWLMAIIESSFIRMFSEAGRLHGMLARKEVLSIGRRFDWFAGRLSDAPTEERMNSMQRLLLAMVLIGMTS